VASRVRVVAQTRAGPRHREPGADSGRAQAPADLLGRGGDRAAKGFAAGAASVNSVNDSGVGALPYPLLTATESVSKTAWLSHRRALCRRTPCWRVLRAGRPPSPRGSRDRRTARRSGADPDGAGPAAAQPPVGARRAPRSGLANRRITCPGRSRSAGTKKAAPQAKAALRSNGRRGVTTAHRCRRSS
jgi:hypothetical protein